MLLKKSPQSRSPIREPAKRRSGESVRERLDDEMNNMTTRAVALIIVPPLYALGSWWQFITNQGIIYPITSSVIAILLISISIPMLVAHSRNIRNLVIGHRGELNVADELDQLRDAGWHVVHDIVDKNHNIDHAVITDECVWVIETKAISKRSHGNKNTIAWDGITIRLNGSDIGTAHLNQAEKNRIDVEQRLRDRGYNGPVHAVVLYPGWFVESSKNGLPLIANPKFFVMRLIRRVDNANRRVLSPEQQLLAFHLLDDWARQPLQ